MKKFRYRLQALLKLREHVERERQKELAAASLKVQDQQHLVQGIYARTESALENKREHQTGKIDLTDMQLFSRFLYRLKRDTIGGEEILRALKKAESQRRQALLEAAREKKIYEKLKERQQTQFYKDFETAATREADEAGLNGFRARRKSSAS